jgi:hypothetical protein
MCVYKYICIHYKKLHTHSINILQKKRRNYNFCSKMLFIVQNCWFCNRNSNIWFAKKNSWFCEHCKQYNGFNEVNIL